MDRAFGHLRLFSGGPTGPADEAAPGAHAPAVTPVPPTALANRELLRPPTYRRGHHEFEPYSAAWYDELQHKRYSRHGGWLPSALEFGRHPGESVLLLNPGLGSDAVRYLQEGTEVTIASGSADHPERIRENLARHGYEARIIPIVADRLPCPDGTHDIVVWNAIHHPIPDTSALPDEVYRVLKAGGKVIGLFPAYYDAGFWQDLVLPLQRLYWRRPPDPTSTPKTTRKELRRLFSRFVDHRVWKRHLRRSELPHPWRVLPLAILERIIGRVLILKAFKPLTAARSTSTQSATLGAVAA